MIAIFLTLFLAALSIIVVWKRVGKKNPKLPPGKQHLLKILIETLTRSIYMLA